MSYGEQPSIPDPEVRIGAMVYADPDISAHRGRVQKIEDNVAEIDFHDWIARIPITKIQPVVLREGVFLVAQEEGVIITHFGLHQRKPKKRR